MFQPAFRSLVFSCLYGLFTSVLLIAAARAQVYNPGHTIGILALTTTYTNSTNSFTNVPGISFVASANSTYLVTCFGNMKQGTLNGGFQLQWTGPSSPTGVQITAVVGNVSKSANAFSSAMATTLSPTTSDTPAMLTLSIINGSNAGMVQLQAASDVSSDQLTIETPFVCTVAP